jgi:beta-lactamase superfamily II metal-dependent hydrolase
MLFFITWIVETRPPDLNEVEITLFGPGIGESIIAHLGNNEWLIVDSCRVGNAHKPAALSYLEKIGIDPAEAVRLIVVTHWHNDHIKGLSEVAQACANAKFVCPQVFIGEEFRTLIELQNIDSSFTSDTSEFDKVIRHYAKTGRLTNISNHPFVYAVPNRTLWTRRQSSATSEGKIISLSPSDKAITDWLQGIKEQLLPSKSPRRRIVPLKPNQISTALWVHVGQTKVLLSADLEEDGSHAGGWRVIVESNERPPGKASNNKIAHHGSGNGHFDGVWTEMLEQNPLVMIAPYNTGINKLPAPDDITRITALSDRSYITSDLKDRSFRGKTGSVNRTIHEVATKIRTIDSEHGYIRARKLIEQPDANWRVELFGRACHLSNL